MNEFKTNKKKITKFTEFLCRIYISLLFLHFVISVFVMEATIKNYVVSTLNRCKTNEAQELCLYDINIKLECPGTYDIGGTYTCTKINKPDFWFFYKTAACPGGNFLLSLFVCNRNASRFSIGVSNSNNISHQEGIMENEVVGRSYLTNDLQCYFYNNCRKNEEFYLKTFCFSEQILKSLTNKALHIKIKIIDNAPCQFQFDISKRIKMNHDFHALVKKCENTDFALKLKQSAREIAVHKMLLCAHSPVLRQQIMTSNATFMELDITEEELDILLEFIYTGTIQDIFNQDKYKLLNLAEQYQLSNLFLLMQYALSQQINVDNAVEIVGISDKYNLEILQKNVFDFIKSNLDILNSDGWKNFKNVNITKKLFQYIVEQNSIQSN